MEETWQINANSRWHLLSMKLSEIQLPHRITPLLNHKKMRLKNQHRQTNCAKYYPNKFGFFESFGKT